MSRTFICNRRRSFSLMISSSHFSCSGDRVRRQSGNFQYQRLIIGQLVRSKGRRYIIRQVLDSQILYLNCLPIFELDSRSAKLLKQCHSSQEALWHRCLSSGDKFECPCAGPSDQSQNLKGHRKFESRGVRPIREFWTDARATRNFYLAVMFNKTEDSIAWRCSIYL